MSKTVEVFRTFDYQPSDRRVSIRFHGGRIFRRVIDAAATSIERAGAGRILPDADSGGAAGPHGWFEPPVVDASHAFKARKRF